MKVFVDNDIAVKLAQWGLLTRFGQHLVKQGGADVYVVHTLRWKFKLDEPANAAALVGSTSAAKQLQDFAALCKPAKGHDDAVATALTDVQSVDAGEAALFAAAAGYDAALVDTGDKRALRAIGALGSAHPATKALLGKISCLEQTMEYLVKRWTFAPVSKAVLSQPRSDASTLKCFAAESEAAVISALQAKTDELRQSCAGLLSSSPFAWIP